MSRFTALEILAEFASASRLNASPEWLDGSSVLTHEDRVRPSGLGHRSALARRHESSTRWARLKVDPAKVAANRKRAADWRLATKADTARAAALRKRQAEWVRAKRAKARKGKVA